jgi:hypothetical protein
MVYYLQLQTSFPDVRYEIWVMGYGLWDMRYGLWDMGYEIWVMRYGL